MKKTFLAIAIALLLLFGTPPGAVLRLRSTLIAGVIPHTEASFDPVAALQLDNNRMRQQLAYYGALEAHTGPPGTPAHVIYRSPGGWNNALWLDIGSRAGVSEDSPVVLGDSLVGVIDWVGPQHSRVRLITDPNLSVAVRAARGGLQDRELHTHILAVQEALQAREDLFKDPRAAAIISDNLTILRAQLAQDGHTALLAKGEIKGSPKGHLLSGCGFNYDHADEAGPARDLRTGMVFGTHLLPVAILKEGDLLVTSGLDGRFPPGLNVGRVVSVDSLNPGSYAYTLVATPTAGPMDDLTTLFVLPPR